MQYRKLQVYNLVDFKVFVLTILRYGLGTNALCKIYYNGEKIGSILMDYVYAFDDDMVSLLAVNKDHITLMAPILLPSQVSVANDILNSFIERIEESLNFDINNSVIRIEYHDIVTFDYDLKTKTMKKNMPTEEQLERIKIQMVGLVNLLDIKMRI